MDIPRRIEQEQVEDNTVEITDLDQIDDIKSRLPPWLIRKALIWQLPENRRRWRWATILGIVFLALLVIVLILGDALSSWIASYLHIGFDPRPAITSNAASSFSDITTGFHASRQDGLACLVDAAWSPNGTSIA